MTFCQLAILSTTILTITNHWLRIFQLPFCKLPFFIDNYQLISTILITTNFIVAFCQLAILSTTILTITNCELQICQPFCQMPFLASASVPFPQLYKKCATL
jgi:hypothetical protein